MAKFGKRLTFIAFLLALLCLAPVGFYQLFGSGKGFPVELGLLAVVGFQVFALLSFIGMTLWAIGEIRREKALHSKSRQ
jgi:hypothetical protein